jgi:hypothetical protein
MSLGAVLPENILKCLSPADRAKLGVGGLTAAEAVAKANKRLEREEQRIFAGALTRWELPFYWHRTDKPTGAIAGLPDFIVGLAGKTLWIEFKAKGRLLSPEQSLFRARLGAQGVTLHIVHDAAEAIRLVKIENESCATLERKGSRLL